MNLEVLFYGEKITGNETYRQIAISHADKTMQNHVRADGTCSLINSEFPSLKIICRG